MNEKDTLSSNMENDLRISVVMSVYHQDKATFVEQAVESILNQTHLPSEVIIVVDGPVDEELNEILEKYSQHNLVNILRLAINKGLANALNKGIALTEYSLIARMDADDISVENRFELQVNYLKEHPEIDVIGGSILEFEGEDVKVRTERKVPEFDPEIKKGGRLICPINHPTVIFRKEKFLSTGGYSEKIFPEDYYLWLRMFKHGLKFHNLQAPLLLMRVDQGMINRRSGVGYLKKELRFFNTAYKEGLLPLKYYLINISMRSAFRLLPVGLLERSYVRFFRKNPSSL